MKPGAFDSSVLRTAEAYFFVRLRNRDTKAVSKESHEPRRICSRKDSTDVEIEERLILDDEPPQTNTVELCHGLPHGRRIEHQLAFGPGRSCEEARTICPQ